MDTTPLTPFRITTDGIGPGSVVEIDGRDVTSHLSAVRFDLTHNEPARLTLLTTPLRGAIEGVAIVDQVVQVLYLTGKDMCTKYKETSEGGLAVVWVDC